MTLARPMFPPRAESVDSFPLQPALPQPETENLTGDSPKPPEGFHRVIDAKGRTWFRANEDDAMELALLRFVRFLVRVGATIEEAAAVVASELGQAAAKAEKMRRQSLRRSQLSLTGA